ncbi:DUF2486 family protein [Ralstonia pseudosolanacearum]|uniref:DUF2486 family protein n=1 Tax=Ralstonia pseudosolanacearum TaxID=1310165 RepID=UPI0007D758C1|nr:DUF2486 family protein [Ralstonia pseudosolanacearum]MDC6293946.1 DUF2486 family protein [Ralstonia pseudosolanacearum]MDD7788843.1 DUF2486 family protein [Ralstonia pseudosolanacearum]MDN3370126.1 DUF2486 family protein [Ralstonia pseudosolanacearum]OAK90901.1 hypothetical protein AB851_11655 [Ralstonia pseudosolanacearum]QOK87703.1 DUF2486 family protein [Ralstonia pseudosolanacearum]
MTPDGRNPGPNADNNIPVLTEIVELETQVPAQAPPVQAPPHAAAAAAIVPPALREQGLAPTPALPPAGTDAARVMGEVMWRFQSEWPALIEAQCRAALESRLSLLTEQLAADLTRTLEARLMDWLGAALDDALAPQRRTPPR